MEALTDEDDLIKGFSLYLFGKQCLTFARSNTEWVDDDGKPYGFKLDGSVLFVKKIAIGFGERGA